MKKIILKSKDSSSSKRGFSIIEIILSLVILGVISFLVIKNTKSSIEANKDLKSSLSIQQRIDTLRLIVNEEKLCEESLKNGLNLINPNNSDNQKIELTNNKQNLAFSKIGDANTLIASSNMQLSNSSLNKVYIDKLSDDYSCDNDPNLSVNIARLNIEAQNGDKIKNHSMLFNIVSDKVTRNFKFCGVKLSQCVVKNPCDSIQNSTPFASNSTGSVNNPHVICNFDHLNNVRNHINSDINLNNFKLGNDIDLSRTQNNTFNSGQGWDPIPNFKGNFSGCHLGKCYKLTDLYINKQSSDFNSLPSVTQPQGLFGAVLVGSTLSDLILENFDVKGDVEVGSLAGSINNTSISNIKATDMKVDAILLSGAFIGNIQNNSNLNNIEFSGLFDFIKNVSILPSGSNYFTDLILQKYILDPTFNRLYPSFTFKTSSMNGVFSGIISQSQLSKIKVHSEKLSYSLADFSALSYDTIINGLELNITERNNYSIHPFSGFIESTLKNAIINSTAIFDINFPSRNLSFSGISHRFFNSKIENVLHRFDNSQYSNQMSYFHGIAGLINNGIDLNKFNLTTTHAINTNLFYGISAQNGPKAILTLDELNFYSRTTRSFYKNIYLNFKGKITTGTGSLGFGRASTHHSNRRYLIKCLTTDCKESRWIFGKTAEVQDWQQISETQIHNFYAYSPETLITSDNTSYGNFFNHFTPSNNITHSDNVNGNLTHFFPSEIKNLPNKNINKDYEDPNNKLQIKNSFIINQVSVASKINIEDLYLHNTTHHSNFNFNPSYSPGDIIKIDNSIDTLSAGQEYIKTRTPVDNRLPLLKFGNCFGVSQIPTIGYLNSLGSSHHSSVQSFNELAYSSDSAYRWRNRPLSLYNHSIKSSPHYSAYNTNYSNKRYFIDTDQVYVSNNPMSFTDKNFESYSATHYYEHICTSDLTSSCSKINIYPDFIGSSTHVSTFFKENDECAHHGIIKNPSSSFYNPSHSVYQTWEDTIWTQATSSSLPKLKCPTNFQTNMISTNACAIWTSAQQ